jgi:hypothetical protein
MIKETAYIKILTWTNKALIIDPDRYWDKVKYLWFNKIKVLEITCVFHGEVLPP